MLAQERENLLYLAKTRRDIGHPLLVVMKRPTSPTTLPGRRLKVAFDANIPSTRYSRLCLMIPGTVKPVHSLPWVGRLRQSPQRIRRAH
jgi:hypothetical protein